jgi:hypothetical protein
MNATRKELVLRLRAAAKDLWHWTVPIIQADADTIRTAALESLGEIADELGTVAELCPFRSVKATGQGADFRVAPDRRCRRPNGHDGEHDFGETPPSTAALDPDVWVVWSYEHAAWWGPNRCGYFADLLCAGTYTEAEAREIEQRANQYRPPASPNERALELTGAIAEAAAGVPFMRPFGPCVIDALLRSLPAPRAAAGESNAQRLGLDEASRAADPL